MSKIRTDYRGGSRGRVQGVRTPPWDDLRLSNTTGILQKKCGLLVLVTPFLSGASPPKKNPGSAPAERQQKLETSSELELSATGQLW